MTAPNIIENVFLCLLWNSAPSFFGFRAKKTVLSDWCNFAFFHVLADDDVVLNCTPREMPSEDRSGYARTLAEPSVTAERGL